MVVLRRCATLVCREGVLLFEGRVLHIHFVLTVSPIMIMMRYVLFAYMRLFDVVFLGFSVMRLIA